MRQPTHHQEEGGEGMKKEVCPHKEYRTCRFTGKRCNNCNDKKFNPAHIQRKVYSLRKEK